MTAHPAVAFATPRPVEPGPHRVHAAGPQLTPAWRRILRSIPDGHRHFAAAARASMRTGTGLVRELVATGKVDEAVLYRAIAEEAGLEFMPEIDPADLVLREELRLALLSDPRPTTLVRIERPGVAALLVLAADEPDPEELAQKVAALPDLKRRLVLATPTALRKAVVARTASRLARDAQAGLFERLPAFSGRIVASAWQGAVLGGFLVALPVLLVAYPVATLVGVHVFATLMFSLCVILRLLALSRAAPPSLVPLRDFSPRDLPVYSVLVALHREKDVVPQLLVALGRLQWPRSRLEIKLVCEADDSETLEALRAHRLHPAIEIVEVPPGLPRTKPKALMVALPLCKGEFVALYDAEDRPHPAQLLEAWQRFAAAGEDLACVQAPLVVTNGGAGMLSRMFAFEYAGLFRGMLIWLAARRLVLPLGGTSNHFRRSALQAIGGWDSHNVTEDADLGLRLLRFGYRTDVISRPTLEDAPEDLATWLPQRVRWFKGWVHTWLVHMREPVRLMRELGPASFVAVQVLFLGMVVSAMVHPIFVITILYALATMAAGATVGPLAAALALLDVANIALGYGAFIALGAFTLARRERGGLFGIVLATPLYWLFLSLAAWLAVAEIYLKPHHWNKTPHRRARPPEAFSAAPRPERR